MVSADFANTYRIIIEDLSDIPVTCICKHIDEVTKTIVEDVTQVVSRMNYINNESDFHFTKEEQIVYEVLQKKKELNAIAVKERGVYEKH